MLGPPPYPPEHVLDYLPILGQPNGHDYGFSPTELGGFFPGNLIRRELGPIGAVGATLGMIDRFGVLYPTWQGVDLRVEAARLEVPVYLAQGAHEHPGRQTPAREWFDALAAPSKVWL